MEWMNIGTYRVQKGDTLEEIAKSHSVTVEFLKKANKYIVDDDKSLPTTGVKHKERNNGVARQDCAKDHTHFIGAQERTPNGDLIYVGEDIIVNPEAFYSQYNGMHLPLFSNLGSCKIVFEEMEEDSQGFLEPDYKCDHNTIRYRRLEEILSESMNEARLRMLAKS